jgi:hypothetical protein
MEENLTLKQKDRIAKRIYQKYRDAQLNLLYVNQHYNLFPQVDLFRIKEAPSKPDASFLALIQKKQELEQYISIINDIHSHLSKDTFFFVENEYLNFYDSQWWICYFSRASYYRLKHKALDEFLKYVHDIIGVDASYLFDKSR